MPESDVFIRMTSFVGVFALMLLWEWVAPRRSQAVGRAWRWPANLSLAAINAILVRFLTPVTVIGAATIAQAQGWGILNATRLPAPLAGVLAFLALDLVIYAQHVAFHRVGPLWRLHRVHHADVEFDVTTGLRFHPGEAIVSLAVKLAAVIALGAPAVAVLVFEVVLNLSSMFNHGNVRMPAAIDAVLRCVIVTPDMHRVHHSADPRELNRNFGFNLPWWDRLFGTYREQPRAGHVDMVLGVDRFRSADDLRLPRLLMQPWSRQSSP